MSFFRTCLFSTLFLTTTYVFAHPPITYVDGYMDLSSYVSDGTYNASLSLPVPVGAGGYSPKFSLAYSTGAVNGYLGVGWNLTGLSSISRCTQNALTDGKSGSIQFDGDDQFCMGAERLVLVSGTHGETGAEYRLENEQFVQITVVDAVSNAPLQFKAKSRDGAVSYFGGNAASIATHDGASANDVSVWLLESQQDISGNQIHFEYLDNGQRLDKVLYEGGEIKIVYQSRTDNLSYFSNGSQKEMEHLIRKIKIYRSDPVSSNYERSELFREFLFAYDVNSETNRSRLETLTECVKGRKCKTPIIFEYGSVQRGFESEPSEQLEEYFTDRNHVISLDIDGDGIEELLEYRVEMQDVGSQTTEFFNLTEQQVIPLYEMQGGSPVAANNGVFLANLVKAKINNDAYDDLVAVQINPVPVSLYLNNYRGVAGSIELVYLINDGAGGFEKRKINLFTKYTSGFNAYFGGVIIPASADLTDAVASSVKNFLQPTMMDFNGDGYQDLAYCEPIIQIGLTGLVNKTWYYQVILNNQNEGWQSKINTGVKCGQLTATSQTITTTAESFVAIDLDANGLQDFIVPTENGTNWKAYFADATYTKNFSTGEVVTSLTFAQHTLEIEEPYSNTVFADINGDYLMDVLFTDSNDDLKVHFNTGLRGADNYLAVQDSGINVPAFDDVRSIDYDDNGLSDLLYFDGNVNGKYKVLLSDGMGGFTSELTDIEHGSELLFVDVDGNGYADAILRNTGDNAWDIQKRHGSATGNLPLNDYLTKVILNNGIEQTIGFELLNTGSIYTFDPVSSEKQVIPAIGPYMMVSEVTSDDGIGGENITFYRYQNLRIHTSNIGSLGFEKVFSYQQYNNGSLTPKYRYKSSTRSQDFGKNLVGMVLQAEAGISTCIDPDNVSCHQVLSNSDFVWRTKVYDESDQILCNETSDSSTACDVHDYASDGLRMIQYMDSSEVYEYELDDTLVSQTSTSYSYDDYGNNTQTVEMVRGGGKAYETTSNSQFAFDNPSEWYLGKRSELTNIFKEYDDAGGSLTLVDSETRVTEYTYYPYDDSWVPGAIHTTTTNAANSDFAVTQTFTYNAKGLLESTELTADNIESRTNYKYYDSSYRWLEEEVDVLGHSTIFSDFHPVHGLPRQFTSINALDSFTDYDNWGRAISQINPDDTDVTTERGICDQNCSDVRAKYYEIDTFSSGAERIVYKDILYRTILMAETRFDGELAYTRTEYDKYGRAFKSSIPYFSGDTIFYKTIDEYDDMDRPVNITEPGGTVITASYTALEAQSDVAYLDKLNSTVIHKVTTTQFDVRGNEISVEDNQNNILAYAYDVLGNLVSTTDSESNQIIVQYDENNARTYISDPDKGISQYFNSAIGEVLLEIDARGFKTCHVYDVAGRKIKRYENFEPSESFEDAKALAESGCDTMASADATWAYDTRWNDAPDSVTGVNGYEKQFYYDNLGRVSSIEETIGGVTYTLTHDYYLTGSSSPHNLGKLKKTTYPVENYQIEYAYSDEGILNKVFDVGNASILWELKATNARGQKTEEEFNSGLLFRTHEYEAETGLLQNIRTWRGVSEVVQDNYYTFNSIGDLQQRAEIVGAVDGFAARDLEEIFAYDDLRRLTSTTLTNHLTSNPAQVQSVDYDVLGNITHKSDMGDYKYGSDCTNNGFGPHAVCEITNGGANNTHFTYDAAGNMLTGSGKTITYTTFGKPDYMSAPEGDTTITYGAEKTRIKRVDNLGLDTTTTTYAHGLFEKVVRPNGDVEEKLYLGDFAVLTFYKPVSSATTSSTDFLLKDNLGSIIAIMDSLANMKQRFSYDAWGERRKEDVWEKYTQSEIFNFQPLTFVSSVLVNADPITTRGFTGHEMLDVVNLIHMNGRVYNPQLGRFLSVDPIIKDPEDQQNYNRYSYVLNNPLSYIDPTGMYQVSSNFVSNTSSSVSKGGSRHSGVNYAAIGAGILFAGAMVAIVNNIVKHGNARELGRAVTQAIFIPLLVVGTCIVVGPVCAVAAIMAIPMIQQQRKAERLAKSMKGNSAGFIRAFNSLAAASGPKDVDNSFLTIPDSYYQNIDSYLAEQSAYHAQGMEEWLNDLLASDSFMLGGGGFSGGSLNIGGGEYGWFMINGHKYAVGRKGVFGFVPGKGFIPIAVERFLPAGHTFGTIHDYFVKVFRDELGHPDFLVNIPSMLPSYLVAVIHETVNSINVAMGNEAPFTHTNDIHDDE